ncbi:MAG: hypothetical protein R5N65_00040 [Cutibacterium granulosum]|uniref:hypothetical protein n=1 Tax=Cutibacterium granulosum TaxID=33011 RepID=UPI002B2295F5|nr:hypothetical protein [Cutibacterium granulosum]MEA5643991.1 hypothetical protein [Cutibacterium granulosum]
MSSISRRLFVQAGAMVTLAGVAVQRGWPANAAPYTKDGTVDGHLGARGCIALLPDTQFYSRYGVESADLFAKQYPGLPNPYDCQTQWIVDHTADYHIAMTHHLGDVCDQSGEGHEDQYVVADRAMKILDDAKVSYSVIPGNHDVADDFHYYRTWFPKDRQAHSPSFREMGPSGMSNWHEFTVAGVPMMAVNVPWGSDGADLDWAESVLNAHPTVPTIITTHQIIDISPDGTALSTSFGQRLWDRLIDHHNQVFLTVNGHHHGATNRIVTNAAGQPVFQQLLDYQMAYQGGNGLMALMEFDFTHNQLCQTAFSPWVPLKGERANSLDRALLTGPGDTWVTSFDFASRFASFDADFHPTGEVPAATTALRAQLRKEFTPDRRAAPRQTGERYGLPHASRNRGPLASHRAGRHARRARHQWQWQRHDPEEGRDPHQCGGSRHRPHDVLQCRARRSLHAQGQARIRLLRHGQGRPRQPGALRAGLHLRDVHQDRQGLRFEQLLGCLRLPGRQAR